MKENKHIGISYSGTHPSFSQDAPESFIDAGKIKAEFDQVRDPFIKKQLAAMKKSEASRAKEGDGSKMVKLHKPFPELKPKNHIPQVRASFNNAWLQEQRTSQLRLLREQDRQRTKNFSNDRNSFPERHLDR